MAAGDVIQKDLGLVTAYGYALAGGYTGSEEQFKKDFAALMSGQYTALGNKPSINGVTLVGNKTTEDLGIQSSIKANSIVDGLVAGAELFESDSHSCLVGGVYFGNITYMTLTVKTGVDITVSDEYELCRASVKGNAGENVYILAPENASKRVRTGPSSMTTTFINAMVIGLADGFNETLKNKVKPVCELDIQYNFSEKGWDYFYVIYNLKNISGESEVSIPSGTEIVISSFFVNRLGVYD